MIYIHNDLPSIWIPRLYLQYPTHYRRSMPRMAHPILIKNVPSISYASSYPYIPEYICTTHFWTYRYILCIILWHCCLSRKIVRIRSRTDSQSDSWGCRKIWIQMKCNILLLRSNFYHNYGVLHDNRDFHLLSQLVLLSRNFWFKPWIRLASHIQYSWNSTNHSLSILLLSTHIIDIQYMSSRPWMLQIILKYEIWSVYWKIWRLRVFLFSRKIKWLKLVLSLV